jgi:hypothetical protein
MNHEGDVVVDAEVVAAAGADPVTGVVVVVAGVEVGGRNGGEIGSSSVGTR